MPEREKTEVGQWVYSLEVYFRGDAGKTAWIKDKFENLVASAREKGLEVNFETRKQSASTFKPNKNEHIDPFEEESKNLKQEEQKYSNKLLDTDKEETSGEEDISIKETKPKLAHRKISHPMAEKKKSKGRGRPRKSKL